MNTESANMYGLLKVAGIAGSLPGTLGDPAVPLGDTRAAAVAYDNTAKIDHRHQYGIGIGDSGTGTPWSENYAGANDVKEHIEDTVGKRMSNAGYDVRQMGVAPGKGTAFQGGDKPGFARDIMQAARGAIHTSKATVPVKVDYLKKLNREFIGNTQNLAYNPYGMDKLQVQGTGKTLGEVAQGWKPADADTYAWNSAGQTAGKPLGRHTPVQNQFGMTGLISDQKAQAPQVSAGPAQNAPKAIGRAGIPGRMRGAALGAMGGLVTPAINEMGKYTSR